MAWTSGLAFVACISVRFAHTFEHLSLQPPKQSPWQKALFDRIEKNAMKLSDDATPELLKRLDEKRFRLELAACCPSVKNLSAQELLQKLQAEVAVVEVVSGFPAVSDTKNMYPDTPGMSIADGMAGSFFQNAWQAVLLHAREPEKVFHRTSDEYVTAGCNETDNSITFQQWTSPGCKGRRIDSGTYPQNQCMHDSYSQSIFRYTCQGSKLYEEDWDDDQANSPLKKGRRYRRSDSKRIGQSIMYPNVTCPARAPEYVGTYIADNQCHAYVAWNASDGWTMEDDAEQHSYGLKPFSASGCPKSLMEASERGPYALVNNFQIDMGSPLYGDVSAVFSIEAVKRTALLSAIDTGFFQSSCVRNQGSGGIFQLEHNCSAYVPLQKLGTLKHFNHLHLINDDFWQGQRLLARRFARLERDWGSSDLPARDLLHYWEALPAGTMQYPEDVRFLIGSFPNLFGSPLGARLQDWAKQRKWVLIWSLGLNIDGQGTAGFNFQVISSNRSFALNQRLVDPEVALETTAGISLSITNATLRSFRQYWKQAEYLRWIHGGYVKNTTWTSQWHELRDRLPSRLHVRPLRGGECSRSPKAPECVGMSKDLQCICYADNATHFELLV